MKLIPARTLASSLRSARRSRGTFTNSGRVWVVTLAPLLCCISSALSAQSAPQAKPRATPAPQGSFVSDPAIPTLISPSEFRSEYFVLNQDFSLLTHSSVDNSLNSTCAAPSGFDGSSATPRTFLNDTQNAYFTGQLSSGANAAVSGFSFINTGLCETVTGPSIAGGTPAYTLSSNDRYHARLYELSGFNGNGPDTLTVEVNLNNATSGGNTVTQLSTVNLDTGGQYTSLVTDTLGGASGISLTAITELKTATSPGNLWIYNQNSGAAYKILGPGGVPLPAVTSFIIPAQTNGGGNLLVLVNQDNLTAANLSNPPLDTTPFTIIDLGQLIQTFSIQTSGGTITLPFVTQIGATTPYFAMLGPAYNPVTRLVYAVVGGGSASGVTGNVISYDPFHPGSPNETVVADISTVPFSYGAYPQLALSAAAGTLQILTPAPSALYSVGILGTGNTAVSVPGSTFPDASFQPTFIAANTLLGETYIASASGQVDILTNGSAKPLATFTLNGTDIATTTQSYTLQATALYAVHDDALSAAPVTITATPQGSGSAFTASPGSFADFVATPGNISITFPALGVYTLVASIPATANYPAITSNPINVTVASNFIAGVYPTLLSLTAPANPPTTAVNVLVSLSGSTYAPTGYINVSDANGNIVGTTYFNGAALVQPTTVAVTLVQGSNTLTASYSGDAQNAASTSPPLTVSVGTQVTPVLALTVASPAIVGNSVTGNVKFTSTTTNVPTGSVTVYGMLAGSSTPTTLATVTAAQAFTSSGANYSFKAPAAGTYLVSASYAGDANYATATSASTSLIVNAAAALDTTLTVTPPASATANLVFKINIKLASAASTQTPTGNINVTAQLAGSTTSTNIGMIDPSQAYAASGTNLTAQFSTAGIWTITASYMGDQNFQPSTGTAMLTVSPATVVATTLKITAPANVAVNTPYTAVVKLTAASTLTNGPSGLVTIVVTSSTGAIISTINTTAASAFLGSGYSATIPAATASGTYTLTASYAGDTNYAASSTTSTVTVGSTLDTTSLGISGPTNVTINVGSPVTIRLAAQTGATATPTGNVTIMTTNPSGVTATIGTITAAQALANGGDVAEIKYTLLGNFTVTVTYAGDSNFSGSTASLVVTVANPVVTPTTLGVSGPATVDEGVSFSVAAALKITGTSTTPITGNVTLVAQSPANSYTLGTMTAAQVSASGGTIFTASIPVPGTYTITATYPGDANYAKSSGAIVVKVNIVPVKTAVGLFYNYADIAPATPFLVQVTLSYYAVAPVPVTGKIVLTADTVPSTGAPLIQLGTFDVLAASTGSGATMMVQFPAGLSGNYVLSATYPGDAYYASSFSNGIIGLTGGAVALALTGPRTAVAGVPVQLNLAAKFPLLDLTAAPITVTSTTNGAAGPQTTASSVVAASVSGTIVPLVFPDAGTYIVIAKFPGDALNAAGSSSPITVVVSPPMQGGFTMVLNTVTTGVSLSVLEPDADGTTNVTLTAVGGFNSPVALTLAPSKQTQLKFAFLDASGKVITSATPSATGLPVTIRASGPTYMGFNNLPPGTDKRPAYFAGGLLCLIFTGFRLRGEKARRALTLLGFVVVIGLFGSIFSACAHDDQKMDVVVTATPNSTNQGATAQSVTFHMSYSPNLE